MTIEKLSSIVAGLTRLAGLWILPAYKEEREEFARVSQETKIPLATLYHACRKAQLRPLVDKDWKRLENTDSYKVKTLKQVQQLAQTYGKELEPILNAMNKGTSLPAPIVLEFAGKLILVAGNTRLMAARVLKKPPTVLWVKVD
jgi:hypothetical protein